MSNDTVSKVLYRVLTDLDTFTGLDGVEYNLSKGDMVTLPEDQGELLVKNGNLERYDISIPKRDEDIQIQETVGSPDDVIDIPEPNTEKLFTDEWVYKFVKDNYYDLTEKTLKGALVPSYQGISWHINELYHTISFNKSLYIYHHETGTYREDSGEVVKLLKLIIDNFDIFGTNFKLTSIYNEVKLNLIATNPEIDYPFNHCIGKVPLKNGVYDLISGEFEPHDPEYRFTYRYTTKYNPKAEKSKVLNVLSEWCQGSNIKPEVIIQIVSQAILQAAGFGPFKCAYILEGAPDSGKSSCCDLIMEILGSGNHSEVALQSVLENRFSFAALEGKTLNCQDDLESIPLRQIGIFKKLTGSFNHQIERKGSDSYPGRIFATHLYSCNEPPRLKRDIDDTGFWSRWVYVLFQNSFERDAEFANRTFTDDFKEAFMMMAIKLAKEILNDPDLFYRQSHDDVKEMWLLASDDVFKFVNENLTFEPNLYLRKDNVYSGYVKFCQSEHITPKTLASLSRDLQKEGVRLGRHKIGKVQVHTFDGIRWSDDADCAVNTNESEVDVKQQKL